MRRIRLAARQLRRRFERRVLILVYHRISKRRPDPWSLNVTPYHFAEHLAVLRRRFRPMRLQQLTNALIEGKTLPYRSVVVTFDDGYADNLYNAKPILEQHECPATVFLTTEFVGKKRGIWWDELELLLQPGTLPAKLVLALNGRTHSWQLGEAAQYSEQEFQQHRYWKASEDPPSPRHTLYLALWELLHPLPPTEQQRVLDELLVWAKDDKSDAPFYPTLSTEEVVELVGNQELIEIGAHTMSHPSLAALPIAMQRDEIQRGKACLEEMLDRPVTTFSYPFGKRCDYSATTIGLVQEAKFEAACVNDSGYVRQETDRFQLPRAQVEDWDGDTFARWLDRRFLL